MIFFYFNVNKKLLKQAFYSAAVNLFVGFVISVAVAVYFVFKPFLQPLLWAVLFGSVLHPFKQKIAHFLKEWIQDLQERNASVTLQFLYFPGILTNYMSERLGYFILKHMLVLMVIFVGIPSVLVYFHFFPVDIVAVLMVTFHSIAFLLNILQKSTVMVFTLLLSYIILVNFWCTPISQTILRWISVIVWCVCMFHFAAFCGLLQVPVFLCFLLLLVAGFLTEAKKKENGDVQGSEQPNDPIIVMNFKKHLIWLTSDDKKDVSSRKEQTEKKPVRLSTKYLNWLLYACLTVKFWMNLWLLYFLPLLLICLIVKKIASYLGVLRFVRDRTTTVKNAFVNWVMRRKVVLCPTPVHGLWRIIVQCDSKFSSWIEGSIDTFSSLTVIVILLVTMTIGFLLITVQVYWEAVHLTRITKEIVNKTILSKPVIQKHFPKNIQDVHEGLNVVVDHAYGYGKKAINEVICKLAGGEDEEQVALIEKQFSDIWNQLYQLWHIKYSGTSEIEETVSWSTVLDGLSNLDMAPFIKCVKKDMTIMLKFLKSCWILVKENLVIVYHLFRSIVRILFHSSRAILNFILGLVIFTTALFYLLLISGETYKPVEVISRLLPSCEEGTRVGNLMKSAIQGVFHASFKKAAIYTLYTWLIHTLFQVMLVYIPTIFAGFCGLVPFLEVYWACIPAVLELWLIKDQPIKAALMFGCQLIPIFFVDGLIEEEIQGTGHPYLTGMAIAGGIMCMGLKGAFLGPMLLCFLIVAINMYTAWLRGVSPSMWKTTKKKEMISIDKDTPQDLDRQSKTNEGVSFDADNYQEGKIFKCDSVILQDLDSQSKMNEGVSFDADNYQEGKIVKCDSVIPQDLDSQSKTNEGVSFDADNYQEGKTIKCDAVISQDLDSQSKMNEGVSFDANNYQEGKIIKFDVVIPQNLDSQSKMNEGVSFDANNYQEGKIVKCDSVIPQDLDSQSKTNEGVSFDADNYQGGKIIKCDVVIPQNLVSQSKTNEGVFFDANNYQEGIITKCDSVIPQDWYSQSKTKEGVSFEVESFQEEGIIKVDTVTFQNLDILSKTEKGVSFDVEGFPE